MTVEALPQPVALEAVVVPDFASRTLSVRLSDQADGRTRRLWEQAWRKQRRSQEAGWPVDGSAWLYADLPGAPRVVHGQPVEGGAMAFHFPPGTAGYSELIAKPGVSAIVTIDHGSHEFLTCRLLRRG